MSADYKKIAFHTMGCKLNFSETSMISKDFLSRGFERVKYNEYADFYILNTCSVTDNADKEARKLIRQAKRSNPNSKIAVIGCYAQLNPNEISSIKGVDLVVGSEKKFNLFDSFGCESLLFSYGESSLEFFESDWFFFLICNFFKSF